MSITNFHASMTKTALAFLTAASALVLSSCQDEDYGFTTQAIRDSVYARNFEKTYGKISEVPTWDFSSYNLRKMGLSGGPSADAANTGVQTRALSGLVTKYDNTGNWYTVEPTTIAWLNENLKEKVNNTKYTSPFEWVPDAGSGPKGVFYVIPIYQGQTGMVWNLELVDINISGKINTSTLVWTKSENIQYTQDYSKWEEYFYESGWNKDARNDYKTLYFANAFSEISASTSELKVAFNVKTNVEGSFYITLGGESVKLTNTNAETLFNSIGANSGGNFTFTEAKNVSITEEQELTSTNQWQYNVVNLGDLIGLSIGGKTVDRNALKTLRFEISNGDAVSADKRFQHWSRDYIRVFVHYNGGTSKTITMSDIDNNGQNSYIKHNTVNKYHVQTRPIKIDMSKIEGTSFAFNLRTIQRTDGDMPYSEIGDDHRSDQNFMSLITHFDKPVIPNKGTFKALMKTNFDIDLADNFEYKVIGCEDAGYSGKDSDQDYNDVVFLLVGDKLPNQVIKKRYMIEDLGSTLDFDFNDIVVDVTETVTTNDDGTKKYTQEAKIKHLCGTIPFRVKIGNTYFGSSTAGTAPIMRGHNTGDHKTYDPSALSSVDYSWTASEDNVAAGSKPTLRTTHWDPEANNIYVEVWPSYAAENRNLNDIYWTEGTDGKTDNSGADKNNVQVRQIVEFPKPGKFPYIIATDQTVMWMQECENIPNNWVKTNPQNYPNYPTFPISPDTNDVLTSGSSTGTIGEFGNVLTNRTFASTYGSIVLNSTETALSSAKSIVISKDDIAKAYLGDVLIVKVKGDIYDSSRLNFTQTGTTKGITNVGTNGNVIVTGDYEIPMTEEIMTSLRNNGLTISGTNVTVESVTVRSGVNTATSKSKTTSDVAAGSWVIAENNILSKEYAVSEVVRIPKEDLRQLYVGDKIVIKLSGLRSDSQIGFKKGWEDWHDIVYSNYNIVGGTPNNDGNNILPTGDITLDVTSANIASLRDANGDLIIQGNKVTIESVSVQTDRAIAQPVANPTKISGGTSIYNTKQIINYYNGFAIDASKFNDISVGDQIVVKVDNVRTNSALGFRNTSLAQSSGSWFSSDGNKYYNANGDFSGDYALTVTAENIENIKNGIGITGAYITITDVLIKSTRHVTVAALPAEGGAVKIGDGSFAKTVEGDYDKGTVLTLTASTPNSGYSFVKWSNGAWTYSRQLTLNSNSEPVALYQKGTTVLDLSPSGYAFTDGGSWDNCRYNDSGKGAANYTALENALNTTNNKLHIYFSEKTGTVKLWTFGGHRDAENDNWGWMQVTGDLSFDNYELTVTLTDTQVNQIKNHENHGFVISNESSKAINMYKIIVE